MKSVIAYKFNCIKQCLKLPILFGSFLFLISSFSFAGNINLAWDPSRSTGVGGYKLYYGQASKNYTSNIDIGKCNSTPCAYSKTGLTDGVTYYFALKAYNVARSIESGYSNEASATIASTTTLTADFNPSTSSGIAPLTVTFNPITNGAASTWRWDFPGSYTPVVINTTPDTPVVTYPSPGTYNVNLTVTGSTGNVSATRQIIVTALVENSTPPPGAVVLPSIAAQPQVAGIKNSGLVAAYGFDEARGVRALDSSGNGNHGKIKQAVRVKGRFGKALKFDGVNDWVTVKDGISLALSNAFTLEAWIKPRSIRRSSVIVKQQAKGTDYDLYSFEDFDLPSSTFDDGLGYNTISGIQQLPIKKWVHLTSTFDGLTQRLYIDGVEVASAQVQSSLIKQSNGVLRIGGNSVWGDFFHGLIDEVRVYDRALSNDEILRDLQTRIRSH